jgi:DNA-binding protein HU-beta
LTKRELVRVVARRSGISTAEAQRAVDAMIEVASEELARGGDVTLAGFGKFSVSHRAARLGRNPSTGERVHISHSKSAKFTAARALKSVVAEGGPLPGDPDEEY